MRPASSQCWTLIFLRRWVQVQSDFSTARRILRLPSTSSVLCPTDLGYIVGHTTPASGRTVFRNWLSDYVSARGRSSRVYSARRSGAWRACLCRGRHGGWTAPYAPSESNGVALSVAARGGAGLPRRTQIGCGEREGEATRAAVSSAVARPHGPAPAPPTGRCTGRGAPQDTASRRQGVPSRISGL